MIYCDFELPKVTWNWNAISFWSYAFLFFNFWPKPRFSLGDSILKRVNAGNQCYKKRKIFKNCILILPTSILLNYCKTLNRLFYPDFNSFSQYFSILFYEINLFIFYFTKFRWKRPKIRNYSIDAMHRFSRIYFHHLRDVLRRNKYNFTKNRKKNVIKLLTT